MPSRRVARHSAVNWHNISTGLVHFRKSAVEIETRPVLHLYLGSYPRWVRANHHGLQLGGEMSASESRGSRNRRALAALLRRLRKERSLTRLQAAAAMDLALRTYGNFESGSSAATTERLFRFSRLVDCDYAALLLAAGGFPPALVLASAANKAVSIAIASIDDLRAELPTAFSTLTAAELVSAYGEAGLRLQADAFHKSRQRADAPEDGAMITPRQLECLLWVQAGKSSSDIGMILGISSRTVDDHLAEVCARLGVRTRIQAISKAIAIGLLSPRLP